MNRKRLSIVGNGMATCRLLDELVRHDATASWDITVFGEEPHGAYNRILLNRVLAGGDAHHITTKPTAWYAERGVRFRPDTRVAAIDPFARKLTDAQGDSHAFDAAVLATGSTAFVPPVEGSKKAGVYAYRTIDDCRRIRERARPASSAVVVGGGLLGLEAAKGLSDLGMHVTVVQNSEVLMNAQLDAAGGAILRRAIERLGIFVRTGVTVESVLGDAAVEGVRLTDGSQLPAELVVFACGIRPRVDLAKSAGLPVKSGILVNDTLATQVPGVYAVGECAEHRGKVYGLVQPIWEQCSVLADLLTATNPQSRYRGSKMYARLKVAGVEVASMGAVEPADGRDEVIRIVEERRESYRKLVIRDDKLIGAVLVGHGASDFAASLVQYYDTGDALPENRLEVFCPSGGSGPGSNDPEICNCHHVRESTINGAIRAGCTSMPALATQTKAGSGCGSCRGQLTAMLLNQPRANV